MSYYSDSEPNLIAPKIKQSVSKIMNKQSTFNTLSDNIINNLRDMYHNFFKDSGLVIIISLAVVFLLLYKYYNKQILILKGTYNNNNNKDKNKDNQLMNNLKIASNNTNTNTNSDIKLMQDILVNQTSGLKYDTQPSFNALRSVNNEMDSVNYTPEQLSYFNAVDMNFNSAPHTQDYYKHNANKYQNLNTVDYDYNNVNNAPSRTYYSGTYNPYKNTEDTNISNPLGFSNQFNTTTGSFISGMTNANNQNLTDYQQIINQTQQDMMNSVGIGPSGLDNMNYSSISPPYADDV